MGCPEDEARWFFQQFLIGLDYCHRMGIANRDIKVCRRDSFLRRGLSACKCMHKHTRIPLTICPFTTHATAVLNQIDCSKTPTSHAATCSTKMPQHSSVTMVPINK